MCLSDTENSNMAFIKNKLRTRDMMGTEGVAPDRPIYVMGRLSLIKIMLFPFQSVPKTSAAATIANISL